MAVWYELWTLDSGTMIADYNTEADALAEVQMHMAAHGSEAVSDWALARNGNDESDFQCIADGDALAERALRLHAA
jgi:hypothetical protein